MMVFHFCGRERNFAQRSIRNRSWQIEGKNDYDVGRRVKWPENRRVKWPGNGLSV